MPFVSLVADMLIIFQTAFDKPSVFPLNCQFFSSIYFLHLIYCFYRENHHYIFFLLQVTEAVNLKRAETTAFRKASRLSHYSSTYLKDTDKAILQRTNQGYRQFKAMRGTAPYFEQQKHRLFSMIRYNLFKFIITK